MNILVTGGAGFIGSSIVQILVQQQHTVVVLDDLSGGFIENVAKQAHFIKGSILDSELINRLFAKYKFEYVFHLAAYAAENLSHYIRRYNYNINVIGSINLINAAINHHTKCFVFTSSAAVYGGNKTPFSEDVLPRPSDPYGIAKWCVEQDLMAAKEMFGLSYIVFRPHNVYGERQNIGDKYRNVIGIFFNQIMQGKPITIFGDGQQTRPFTYIQDIAPIIANSIREPDAYNQQFNIGSDRLTTLNELADLIFEISRAEDRRHYLEARQELKYVHVSHDKIGRYLSEKEPTPLKEGLSNMYHWVQQHGSRISQTFDPIEISQKLPNVWK